MAAQALRGLGRGIVSFDMSGHGLAADVVGGAVKLLAGDTGPTASASSNETAKVATAHRSRDPRRGPITLISASIMHCRCTEMSPGAR
jgi:hypothetical protein